jgi:hypothetical protein
MGRWEAGASDRLREAALALYLEHGFEQTMVADIADDVYRTLRGSTNLAFAASVWLSAPTRARPVSQPS